MTLKLEESNRHEKKEKEKIVANGGDKAMVESTEGGADPLAATINNNNNSIVVNNNVPKKEKKARAKATVAPSVGVPSDKPIELCVRKPKARKSSTVGFGCSMHLSMLIVDR